MTVLIPLLAAIVGLVVYALASAPKPAEVGRLLFACGALVSLLVAAQYVVRV